MTVRWVPLLAFTPLAVAWVVLHWRAVRRVEIERAKPVLPDLVVTIVADFRAFAEACDEAAAMMAVLFRPICDAITDAYRQVTELLTASGTTIDEFLKETSADD